MNKLFLFCLAFVTTFIFQQHVWAKKDPAILVFSKTKGYRHTAIEPGKKAIADLGKKYHFNVDTTENADAFTESNLKKYAAVIFLSTTGDVLNDAQQSTFERYIQAGGGFVGIHAASDTEYDWPWYGKLVGAYFLSHPKVQEAKFIIKDKNHPSTSPLADSVWIHTDELYNFKNINPDLKVLITIDETSYKGGENGKFHPFAWYHDYDGGRAFYTSMGHTKEVWSDEKFLKHLTGGIRYAIGKQKKLNYQAAKSKLIN